MTRRQAALWSTLLAVGMLVLSAALYPWLPDQLPIHWGLDGHADGWAPKAVAIVLGPAFSLGLTWLLLWLAAASPRGYRMEAFAETFHYIVFLMAGLFAYIQMVTLAAGLAPQLPSGRFVITGVLLLLAALGNVLGKVRRNYWIGVRTPWTLGSERVWDQTHRLAARLFTAAGVLGGLATLVGCHPAFGLVLILGASFWPVAYSYQLYRDLEKRGEL